MKNVIIIQVVSKKKLMKNVILLLSSILFLYMVISLYFTKHFFFNTSINGVDVSLRSYDRIQVQIEGFIKDYELELIERDNERDKITGKDIELGYGKNVNFKGILKKQKPLNWFSSLFRERKYYIRDLYSFNRKMVNDKVSELHCLTRKIIEPKNVRFLYSNGSYIVVKEVEGNKIRKDKLIETVMISILNGKRKLNLLDKECYEEPKYRLNSEKTFRSNNLLNKYVGSIIQYNFGNLHEVVDKKLIPSWIIVDDNLDVTISKKKVEKYIYDLSKKYDTVGITRSFHTSTGKDILIKGGLYGWKINQEAEALALIERIKEGMTYETEPIYSQRAKSRDLNEIGNTYVEINITKQHVWFYKNGKLIIEGPVVTGNPNRGNSTVVGTHMLNYKQKDVILRGAGYEAKVTYWMPFYGNIGLHDASWRSKFGGEIYKTRGSHGCVNAPLYLAKTVFERIEEGIPVIVYEE